MYIFAYKNLERIRKEKGITQIELGKMIRRNKYTIYQWENDLMTPSLQSFLKICNELDVNPMELIEDDHERF